MLAVSFLVPLFFIQTGKVFEIIQMAWYFLFFCALFSSFVLASLFNFKYSKAFKLLLFGVLLITTLPSAYGTYRGDLATVRSRKKFSSPYFKAMQFLASQETYNATVLEIPNKQIPPTEKDLREWYRASSPAIVAFANKRSYLSNEYIDFPGVNITPRIDFLREVLLFDKVSLTTPEYVRLQKELEKGFLKNKISFIYSPRPLSSLERIKNIHQVYQNQAATIYQVYEN
jgi:hypothetical protein